MIRTIDFYQARASGKACSAGYIEILKKITKMKISKNHFFEEYGSRLISGQLMGLRNIENIIFGSQDKGKGEIRSSFVFNSFFDKISKIINNSFFKIRLCT